MAFSRSMHRFYYSQTESSIYCILEKCKSMKQLKLIHSRTILEGLMSQPNVYSKIISFCCTHEAGDMRYARCVLESIPEPNIFVWNTMIKGYSRINSTENMIRMYKEMLRSSIKLDNYTFPFLLKGFTCEVDLDCGKGVHAHVCKFGFDSNEYVNHMLIHMYCLCGQLDIARGVFELSSKSDVIFWNEMISAYNRRKCFEESRKLFYAMEENQVLPTSVTLVSVLSACAELKDLYTGRRIHQYINDCRVESSLSLENALINLYATCGEMGVAVDIFASLRNRDAVSWTIIVKGFVRSAQLDLAREYFDLMPERDCVSWTAMIDGYIKANRFKEVLELFREMQAANVKPDKYTMVSILSACAHLGALELGEWIKAYMDKNSIIYDVHLLNALIDMYFKCGSVENALEVFRKMVLKDKFTWTGMIVGLAINGHGKEALSMFSKMLEASEMPDEITYIGVLSACTHSGLVNEGRMFFARMIVDHDIKLNVAHYGCMVDLLGRAGKLMEAYEVVKNMPIKPNSIVWGSLLSACRVQKNVDMAETVAKRLLQLEPDNGSAYILLCNIYATCKRWNSLHEVRNLMMVKGIKKIPGCSLIEMNGMVHEFVAGDQSHS
ncbi:hypothetical protein LIER_00770 [Lithospermum erythrorhizon]|uniref:Pentatricopeptide repeat-containing protein n=1 Tax=Lithospermum erythrorhizon TaxID=34254 RepID=A0AAV3NNC2_LITER